MLHDIATGVRGGGDVSDIARLTSYVVDWAPEMAEDLLDGISRVQGSDGFSSPLPLIPGIGVQALWTPDFLVEMEAPAVLD